VNKHRPAVAVGIIAALSSALAVSACGSGDGNGSGDLLLTCLTENVRNVEGGSVSSTLSGTLDAGQNDVGTCETAGAVVRKVTAGGSEMPLTAEGFRCTPAVVSTGPDVVKWDCNFKGADTPTDITIRFRVTYRG